MSNEEIKKYARQHGVRMYELAIEFEMNESVLSRMFRCELDEDMKQVIISTIDRLAADKAETGTSVKKQAATSLMRERVLNKAMHQEKTTTVSSTKTAKSSAKISKAMTTKAVQTKPEEVVTHSTALDNDLFAELLAGTGFDMEGGDING